jgi:hypothetical protein
VEYVIAAATLKLPKPAKLTLPTVPASKPVNDQLLFAFVPISVSVVAVPLKTWMFAQVPPMPVTVFAARLTVTELPYWE